MRATALIAAAIEVEPEQDLDAEPAAGQPTGTEAAADDDVAAEDDLGPVGEPLDDMRDEDLGAMPPFEQPAGPEPVSPDGADDSAAVGPPSQPAAPDRAAVAACGAGSSPDRSLDRRLTDAGNEPVWAEGEG
ncbi:MAG: hypothetical protein ACYTA3_10805 [Planctomycetota bacterium]|jgi:hypothetical protein